MSKQTFSGIEDPYPRIPQLRLAKENVESVNVASVTDFQCPRCGSDLPWTSQGLHVDRTCADCGATLWCLKRVKRNSVILNVISGIAPDIPDMAAVAKSLQRSGTVPDVVISLGTLQTVTSAFVAGLLVMRRVIRAAGGNLVLCDLQPHVRAVLQRLNLHTLLVVRS